MQGAPWGEAHGPKNATIRSMRTPRVFTMAALAILLSALAGGFLGAAVGTYTACLCGLAQRAAKAGVWARD